MTHIQTCIETAPQPEPAQPVPPGDEPPASAAEEPETLPETPATLAAATLLALSGGMLDGAVYLLHGHVFANAMTGNVVLLAIALTTRDYGDALRHVTPLIAFTIGVVLAKYILQFHRRHSLRIALLTEMAGLAIAGALPLSFPSHLLVGLVALTAALQITAFRKLGKYPYNTTFVTGNLRSVFDGAFDVLFPVPPPDGAAAATRRRGFHLFRDLGLICTGFAAGAFAGAALAPALHNHTFWVSDLVLVAVGLLLVNSTRSRRQPHSLR